MSLSRKIAVVGGGYAGFAAAVELCAAGLSVTVYEANKDLGGRARKLTIDNTTLDNGQHILLGAYRQTLQLIGKVNSGRPLSSLLLRLPLTIYQPSTFKLSTKRWPAPLHFLFGLLSARGLSFRDRWKTIIFLDQIRKNNFQIDKNSTVQTFLAEQPKAVLHALWAPLCLAALNTPLALASAQHFLNVLNATFSGPKQLSDFLLPKVDLSTLFPLPAARFIESSGGAVRRAAYVKQIQRNKSGYIVSTHSDHEQFTDVVITSAPQQVLSVIRNLEIYPRIANILASYLYQPIYTIYLHYPCAVVLPYPLIRLDDNPGQWAFDRSQIDGKHGWVAVVISAEGDHQRYSRHELIDRVHNQLQRLLVHLPEPLSATVIAEKRATYACVPGLAKLNHGTWLPGLYFAGDYTYPFFPATLEAATLSGTNAAKLLLSHVERS